MSLHDLARITIGVRDADRTAAFFHAFGLTSNDGRRFATRDGGEQLELVEAPVRGLRAFTVAVDDDDDLDRAAAAITAAGHPLQRTAGAVRTTEPVTGVVVELAVRPRFAPSPPATAPVNAPGATHRWDRPADPVLADHPVRPSSLSHIVLGSPDQPATLGFLTDVIGFRISDEVPGIIAFTRCGEAHHHVAVQAAPVPLLHHMAFEVDSVDEVARGGTALTAADPAHQLWGLGRHAIGSNWFWYLREPGGHFVEYTADLDRISDPAAYEPKAWSGHEFLYKFGPPPPREFLEPADVGEILAAQTAAG